MAGPVLFLDAERGLLERIARGDERALASLYDANWKVTVSYVLRNSGTTDDAKDLLQEALVILWERVRGGRFEASSRLGTFLHGIVRNLWLRRLARRRRETPEDTGDDRVSDSASPLEELVASEEADLVRMALDRLGDPCRRMLLLYYWEEMSMEQIAAAMGFANADTVKSKKYQCKKSLERMLRSTLT
jgi:RNA polymerase sigma factor (sigma-70 family)